MNTGEDDRVRSWNTVWKALVSHNPSMAQKDGAGVDNAIAEICRLQALDAHFGIDRRNLTRACDQPAASRERKA